MIYVMRVLFLIGVGGLVNKVHKLVKIWCDDDFCTTVALASCIGSVVGYRIVFAAASCGETGGINPEAVLKYLHH